MISWKFKCLKCGYEFTAIKPKKDYDACDRCLLCGSKEFDKKIVRDKS